MNSSVLILGSGAREHALAIKLAQSDHVKQVLVAPGNGGTQLEGGKVVNLGNFCQLIFFEINNVVNSAIVNPP